jgi:hypothetical protein
MRYTCVQESMQRSLYFRLAENDKYVDLGEVNSVQFQISENLPALAFFVQFKLQRILNRDFFAYR